MNSYLELLEQQVADHRRMIKRLILIIYVETSALMIIAALYAIYLINRHG